MSTLSEHTRLVNILITLGLRTPDFGHPLEDVGYTLDRIGPTVVLPDSTSVQPDLTFKSHERNRLLVAEAKSGGVDNAQAASFKQLTPDILSSQGITTLPATNLSFETCYACSSTNRDVVFQNEAQNHHGFPILVYEDETLKKGNGSSAFQDGLLENLFSRGVTFSRPPSFSNYPFGEGDGKGWIAFQVLAAISELEALGKGTFTEKDLMVKTHPLLGYMDPKARQYIHRVISDVLNTLNLREEDERFVIKKLHNQEWQVVKFRRTKQVAQMLMQIADEFDQKPDYEDLTSYSQSGS
ncbi:MAG: hypothetical protein HY296_04600 [Thaumarchaeota archaeon]|nr:hypothetical protein [Nitrososphaerota archaeon]